MKNIAIITVFLAICGCRREIQQPYVYPPQPKYSYIELEPEKPTEPQWQEKTFEGRWDTTRHKRLDGIMKCHVTKQSDERWKGRFWGVWQGVSYDYNVEFEGPLDNLRGKAIIDGAPYEWSGSIQGGEFKAEFNGLYLGSFSLKEV